MRHRDLLDPELGRLLAAHLVSLPCDRLDRPDTIASPTASSGGPLLAGNGRCSMSDAISIPDSLLPADGRFGAGPSKIQTSHLDALAATGTTLMGTSHRQAPVRGVVRRVQEGLADVLRPARRLRGGARQRRRDGVLGRRDLRPDPREEPAPVVRGVLLEVRRGGCGRPGWPSPRSSRASPARGPTPVAEAGVDVYAWAHNETSTAVMAPVRACPAPTTTPWCWSTRPPAPAACRST